MKEKILAYDERFITLMRRCGIPCLRIALGVVFLWFGALKIFGVSPVLGLIQSAYPFMPYPDFVLFLGAWEAAVGLGLIFKRALKITLVILWLQMAGTFTALAFSPAMFFAVGNPLLLTLEGEFVLKNLVLVAASLVIAGYEIKKEA